MAIPAVNARRRGRFIVVEEWQRDTIGVYVFDVPPPHGRRLLRADGEWWTYDPDLDPDVVTEPSFRIPATDAGDLLALLGDHVETPADADLRAHRDDTIAVRDRLLTVVERFTEPPR